MSKSALTKNDIVESLFNDPEIKEYGISRLRCSKYGLYS